MLWDVDYTLVGADGLGTRLYEVVFREMFGRELTEVAPKAGRTDRAIIGDTLALAGAPVSAVHARSWPRWSEAAADGAVPGPVAAAARRGLRGRGAGRRRGPPVGAHRERQGDGGAEVAPRRAWRRSRPGRGGVRGRARGQGRAGDGGQARGPLTLRPGLSRAATVLVGDTPLDVEAALATGARAVAVATGSYPAADLAAAGAHVVLPDLTGHRPGGRRRYRFPPGGEKAPLDSGGHRRGAAGHAQLAERAQQVRLHGGLADEQGHWPISALVRPRATWARHLGLPGRQRLARRPAHVADQPFGDRGSEHGLAPRRRPHRASASSAGVASLSRYPVAPASTARRMSASVS